MEHTYCYLCDTDFVPGDATVTVRRITGKPGALHAACHTPSASTPILSTSVYPN